MRRRRALLTLGVGLPVVIFIAVYIYSVATFDVKLTPISHEDTKAFEAIGTLLQEAERKPHRGVDYSSVGTPALEQQLKVVVQLVDVFEMRFGRLPNSLEELTDLPPKGPENDKARVEIRTSTQGCFIYYLSADSYLLNCDGWQPTKETLEKSVTLFDSRKVKLYRIDNHTILLVPQRVAQ